MRRGRQFVCCERPRRHSHLSGFVHVFALERAGHFLDSELRGFAAAGQSAHAIRDAKEKRRLIEQEAIFISVLGVIAGVLLTLVARFFVMHSTTLEE